MHLFVLMRCLAQFWPGSRRLIVALLRCQPWNPRRPSRPLMLRFVWRRRWEQRKQQRKPRARQRARAAEASTSGTSSEDCAVGLSLDVRHLPGHIFKYLSAYSIEGIVWSPVWHNLRRRGMPALAYPYLDMEKLRLAVMLDEVAHDSHVVYACEAFAQVTVQLLEGPWRAITSPGTFRYPERMQ